MRRASPTKPIFTYDLHTVKNQLQKIKNVFNKATIFYSYKTNPTLGEEIYKLGIGLQVTSPQHLKEVLKFASGKDIIYCGKVLDRSILEHLVNKGIHIIANSINQVDLIKVSYPEISIGIRVDTENNSQSTIFNSSKKGVGIPINKVNNLNIKDAKIIGIHNHIASQNKDIGNYRENAKQLIRLAKNLKVRYINIGGGFP